MRGVLDFGVHLEHSCTVCALPSSKGVLPVHSFLSFIFRGVGLSLPVELGGHILSPETMNFKTMKNEPSILVNVSGACFFRRFCLI